ncbi:Putative transposable element [Caligus rogercresseyi]|uniref:Transposable element n=2 Tax=Caligus rogercresseyi TaxID=217165 RepID=A0A7T8HH59_CALRO|nr:Putative transposable element [Caligus rogercresseyi]
MLGVVASDGKSMPPFWFPAGLKVGANEYLDVLKTGNLERKACSRPHPNVASLKSAVHEEWTNMSMDYVVRVCAAFRPRVEAMIEAEGSHFEI